MNLQASTGRRKVCARGGGPRGVRRQSKIRARSVEGDQGMIRVPARDLDRRPGIGEKMLHGLLRSDRLAERHPLARVVKSFVQSGAGAADLLERREDRAASLSASANVLAGSRRANAISVDTFELHLDCGLRRIDGAPWPFSDAVRPQIYDVGRAAVIIPRQHERVGGRRAAEDELGEAMSLCSSDLDLTVEHDRTYSVASRKCRQVGVVW